MKKRTVKIAVTVPATPDAVFAPLTDSRKIVQWSGQKGKVTPKVGGTFEMFDGWAKGKVLEYKPGRWLAYTWVTEDWGETGGESVVRYAFGAHRGHPGGRADDRIDPLVHRKQTRNSNKKWSGGWARQATYPWRPLPRVHCLRTR